MKFRHPRAALFFSSLILWVSTAARADSDHPRYALSLAPQIYYLTRVNHATAFSELGFDDPSRYRFAIGALAYWITPSDWQLGLGFTGLYVTHDQGLTEATYHDDVFGVYCAKAFRPGVEGLEVTAGGLIGASASITEVFSSDLNGKLTETAVALQPAVGADYQVQQAIKVGLLLSYTLTFAESENLKGENIGVSDISLRGVSIGAQLIFGVF